MKMVRNMATRQPKIKILTWDRFYTLEDGESYSVAEIGKSHFPGSPEVTFIHEHKCGVEGDKWYYDIHYTDGSVRRIFNPDEVTFYSFKEEANESAII